jgi:EAL domain-containing protein (putative c-di-GMP-specific phosphodiesterase class I)
MRVVGESMENIAATIQKLHALSSMNVNVSIDDFGTGYSSLAYLAKLPVQVLKIDRSFVSTMLDSPDNMTLVSTMIALAHSLRLKVVAEGVETEETARMLHLLRCDQMQGFLVSEAVPKERISAMLGKRGA